MKNTFLVTVLMFSVATISAQSIKELPITIVDGYGPFKLEMGGVGFDRLGDQNNPWQATYLKTKGTPENWTDVQKGSIDFDIHQAVYQNYYAKNISAEFYDELQKSWNWVPDLSNLSKKPIKCRVAIAQGTDPEGVKKVVVDCNNNGDFSDDLPFVPAKIDLSKEFDETVIQKNSISVSYERLLHGKVVQEKTPLTVVDGSNKMLLFSIPRYATAQLGTHTIAISSGSTSLSYFETNIAVLDELKSEKTPSDFAVKKSEYIKIDGEIYKNNGVDRNKNVLQLEKISTPENELFSTQIGFKAIDFAGKDHKTGLPISLDSLKGKYVLLDFWAIWCGACLNEFPALKALYDGSDKSKFEIIGIASDSPAAAVDMVMEKFKLAWPQILSDDQNQIVKRYSINSFPSSFLIDPNGVIIAKNLRGKELADKLEELLLRKL